MTRAATALVTAAATFVLAAGLLVWTCAVLAGGMLVGPVIPEHRRRAS